MFRRVAAALSAVLALGVAAPLVEVASAASTVPVPATFTVVGAGFGHGVGLSQYGARGLATTGKTGEQIIRHYYTGSTVVGVRDDATVRVNVRHRDAAVTLKTQPLVSGGGKVQLVVDGWSTTGTAADSWQVAAAGAGLRLLRNGALVRAGTQLTVRWSGAQGTAATGTAASALLVDGTAYRAGWLDVRNVGGALEAVLSLRLHDQYLDGVAEMPASWPAAALQAQAIAARSYALARLVAGLRSSCNCHLYSSTADQVYAGWAKESAASSAPWRAAVRATAPTATTGKAAVVGGKVITAYFFSSSGGRTENSEEVWVAKVSYARSVPDDGSRTGNPMSSWTRSISQAKLAAAFGLPNVVKVSVLSRTAGGSMKSVKAVASNGAAMTVGGQTLRSRLGLPGAWVSAITPSGTVATPTVATTPKPVAAPVAKPGDRGPVVMSVQRALGGLPVSGWYGPKTLAAVKAFQAKKKLPVTGIVDATTAKALGIPTTAAKPAPKPAAPVAKPGDRGPVVMSVQRALGGLPVSGWYGPKTLAAVKAFQAKKKLPVTGIVDLTTAKALGLR